jgi:hypothetical protein
MAHNALVSRMLIDQITPHFPKDNKDVNEHFKATVVDLFHDKEDVDWGREDDHRCSPHGDSASSITPPEVCDQGHGRDNRDLHDVICGTDACGQIEN